MRLAAVLLLASCTATTRHVGASWSTSPRRGPTVEVGQRFSDDDAPVSHIWSVVGRQVRESYAGRLSGAGVGYRLRFDVSPVYASLGVSVLAWDRVGRTWEPYVVARVGVVLGRVRVYVGVERHMSNGHKHDPPEHAPSGTALFFGAEWEW